MKNNNVIEFNHVSKKFRKGQKLLLKEALLDFLRPRKEEDFWALRKVSFKIKKGESVGIIGANGSGKSTILKLIAGVLSPTKGEVKVCGRVGPLIELGAGFHPELTGRENIYLNGTILGLTKKEVDEKFDSIVDFAELWDFIDTPVKHYSSGMYMRLGFAIAINIEPDILLIDEILAVGDASFQNKSMKILQEFKKKGTTIVLVSHTLGAVEQFCNRVIYLKRGKVLAAGRPDQVITSYQEDVARQEGKKVDNADNDVHRWGSGEVAIEKVDIVDSQGKKVSLLKTGSDYMVRFKLKKAQEVDVLNLGIGIYKTSGEYCFGVNTQMDKFDVGGNCTVELVINNLALHRGEYYYNVVCFGDRESDAYDWIGSFGRFVVYNNYSYRGVMVIKHQWEESS